MELQDKSDNSVTLGNADVTDIYMAQDKGATVHAAGADLSGSTGLILENDETITNSTDGTVLINGTVAGGTGSGAGVFTSNGDQDVTIQTGNSTTGSITITDGANGNIAITPNGMEHSVRWFILAYCRWLSESGIKDRWKWSAFLVNTKHKF